MDGTCKHLSSLALALTLVAGSAVAQPPQIQRPRPIPQIQSGVPVPRLQLKADLVVKSMYFNQEFCLFICGDQWARELHVKRIAVEECNWQVFVKNQGSARSNPGKVRLQYQAIDGTVTQQADTPAIMPGHGVTVRIPFNHSRLRNPYWVMDTPFRVTVDATHTTVESNEANNTAQLHP